MKKINDCKTSVVTCQFGFNLMAAGGIDSIFYQLNEMALLIGSTCWLIGLIYNLKLPEERNLS